MKRKITVLFVVVAVSLVSLVAYAADWSEPGYVNRVTAGYDDGDVYVMGLENMTGCTYASIKFETSYANTKEIQALATAALISGKRLACYISSSCNGGYQKGYSCRLYAN